MTNTPGTLTIEAAPTTVTVGSSASPSAYGQSVTFTATVAVNPAVAAGDTAVPTGSVQFYLDGSAFGSPVALTGGQAASPAISTLSVGPHSVTAAYGNNTAGGGPGDGDFTGSQSSALSQVVVADPTTAVITSSANPSVLDQSISFTVTVAAAAPGGDAHRHRPVQIDGAKFGSAVALVEGVATSGSIATLKLGNHTIAASYSGDGNFTAGTAPSFTQVVNKDNTTTTLAVTVNPSVYGQTISFIASVAPVAPGSGTPTGSVTFF